MDTNHTRPIAATAAAKRSLERLRAEFGEIVLHVIGGCHDARKPLCLEANDSVSGRILLAPSRGAVISKLG